MFNSIEWLWSPIKARVKIELLRNPLENKSRGWIQSTVMRIAKKIAEDHHHNVWRANHDFILRQLEAVSKDACISVDKCSETVVEDNASRILEQP